MIRSLYGKSTKSDEQIRQEATAAAAADVRAVLEVIRLATGTDDTKGTLEQIPQIAATFYQDHFADISMASIETGSSHAWPTPPPGATGGFRRPLHSVRAARRAVVADPAQLRRDEGGAVAEEIGDGSTPGTICIKCGQALLLHSSAPGLGCPT